ncbi:pre T-cell antigen receptor alpha [Dasypus novemcinctus]|uniref:pre T-cell antigen receptor alpha n=1 Tax=Dasypus novemcinctus TaxID=9361 RepID=UPI00265EC889|nr:pre T-cell antigen receptor alpha [Dasypus novemcinctus]
MEGRKDSRMGGWVDGEMEGKKVNARRKGRTSGDRLAKRMDRDQKPVPGELLAWEGGDGASAASPRACSLAGVRATPFPSLAPPITLLVDGKPQTLVVCLVLDVAPPGLDSPIWFSAGNGSLLDAFTYGPSPAADGTWTGLAQLSLPSRELAAWGPVVCHTGPGAGGRGWSTQPLQLSGDASSVRTCIPEPVRGMPSRALRLAALRLLLFKLLLFDVLLTCSRLRALRAAPTHPDPAPPPGCPGLPARPRAPRTHCLLLPPPPPV